MTKYTPMYKGTNYSKFLSLVAGAAILGAGIWIGTQLNKSIDYSPRSHYASNYSLEDKIINPISQQP